MAARGYEFYLRALKVSLASERSERVGDTFSTKFPKQQKVVVYCKMPFTEML